MSAEIIPLFMRMTDVRHEHEFTCAGCGDDVISFCHVGHPDFCLTCQMVGVEMAKALRDLRDGVAR